MFDWLFEGIAGALSGLYDLVPNYAVAIALLTVGIMVLTTPFTLKGTRSMVKMQLLQPEMRRLQLKYKDDRQKLNEELMAFYKANNLNPLGGCLPMLLQAPIFIVLYRVIRGLTERGPDGHFVPKYLSDSSALSEALHKTTEMMAFGIDLSESASKALSDGFGTGFPHVVLVAVVAVTSYFQQRQIQSRNQNAEIPPQQKMIMRLFPVMFVFISFVAPSAIVVYFVVSNLFRIGVQAYITRSLYRGESALGVQAQAATAEARRLQKEMGQRSEALPRLTKAARARAGGAGDATPADAAPGDGGARARRGSSPGSSSAGGATSGTTRSAPAATTRTAGGQNRSKKKRRRR